MVVAKDEGANVVYGRLLESAHISGYSFERLCAELDWLMEDNRWQQVGPGSGYQDFNAFLKTIDLSPFNMASDTRRDLAQRMAALKGSQRLIANALGVSVGTVNQDLHVQSRTPHMAAEYEREGERSVGVQSRTPPPWLGADGRAVAQVAAKKADKQARDQERHEARERRQTATDLPCAVIGPLHCCPISEMGGLVPPNSVDFIITDPPYGQDAIPLYAELGALASLVLKDGGSLVAMTGQSYLPQIIPSLAAHLTYHWMLPYLTPGGQAPQMWERKVNTFWKPLLWYVKGEYQGKWVGDVPKTVVNDNDKRFHKWGQSENGMADIIDRFTEPGQIILDPFLGGGTTAVVALAMGRSFIGADRDPEAIRITSERLGNGG